jgi:hypothetical protein
MDVALLRSIFVEDIQNPLFMFSNFGDEREARQLLRWMDGNASLEGVVMRLSDHFCI